MQLFLDHGCQLRRDTFVKTEFRYEVSWRLLAPYDDTGRQFKLHAVSLRELMDYLHTPYVKPDDVEVERLPADAEKSWEETNADGDASIADNHSDDRDKVNFLQAQALRGCVTRDERVTNTIIGISDGVGTWATGKTRIQELKFLTGIMFLSIPFHSSQLQSQICQMLSEAEDVKA